MNKVAYALGLTLFIGLAPVSFAEDYKCLSSSEAMAQFQTGEIKNQSYYDEAPLGGARVQRQHPNTYLFAQAKHIIANGRSGAICQYSNHVGLVSTYYVLDMKRKDAEIECSAGKCENISRWRAEWINSTPEEDKSGMEMINVCVKSVDGVDFPSRDCAFVPILTSNQN